MEMSKLNRSAIKLGALKTTVHAVLTHEADIAPRFPSVKSGVRAGSKAQQP